MTWLPTHRERLTRHCVDPVYREIYLRVIYARSTRLGFWETYGR